MGRMGKYGYIPCGHCHDDLKKNIKVKINKMNLHVTVPCSNCRPRHYKRAINRIERKHGGKVE